MEPITYRYNKAGSVVILLICLGLVTGSLVQLIKFIHAEDTVNWLLIICFDCLLAAFTFYIVIKFLVPSIKDKPALEINSKGITVWIRNISVEWTEIAEIEKSGTTISASLLIKFRYKTDYGNYIRIALGPIDCNNQEIYDAMIRFFNYYKR